MAWPPPEFAPPAADETAGAHGRTLQVETRTKLKVRRCRLAVLGRRAPGGPLVAVAELISEKERLRLGTQAGNDLVVEDRTASRQHCELQFTDRGYLLVDLASTNGTFVDGQQIERAFLRPGATITLGSTAIAFTPLLEEIEIQPDGAGQLGGLIGRSLKMRQLFGLLKRIAPLDVSVVIQGETGTGKELVARALHAGSPRAKGPLVVLDCGAISPSLIESELFGHQKGAFTGAAQGRPGVFERARGGTVFLDELGELRLDLQPKLLRVLENREVRRVGGNDTLAVDVRVLGATHRDLATEVRAGSFREDLFFRLSVITLQLPPLRERLDDLPHLVAQALEAPEVVAQHGRKRLTAAAMDRLQRYPWPGNVRELMNVVSHLLTFSEGEAIDVGQLPPRLLGEVGRAAVPFNEHLSFKEAKAQVLAAFERDYLASVLQRAAGNLSRAARESAMHRKSIERLAKKYRLDARAIKRASKE